MGHLNICLYCFNCLCMAKIREMASDILRVYFPWPLPSVLVKEPSVDSAAYQLLDTALRHCNSTRPRECDSGALLCTVVFAGFVHISTYLICINIANIWMLPAVMLTRTWPSRPRTRTRTRHSRTRTRTRSIIINTELNWIGENNEWQNLKCYPLVTWCK